MCTFEQFPPGQGQPCGKHEPKQEDSSKAHQKQSKLVFLLPFVVKSIENTVCSCPIFLADGRKMAAGGLGYACFLADGEGDAFSFFNGLCRLLWNLCQDIGMVGKSRAVKPSITAVSA